MAQNNTNYMEQRGVLGKIKAELCDEFFDDLNSISYYIDINWQEIVIRSYSNGSKEKIILSYVYDAVAYKSERTSIATAKKRVRMFIDELILEQL